MIKPRFLSKNHYIKSLWELAIDLSGKERNSLVDVPYGTLFDTVISPALPFKFPGTVAQWQEVHGNDAAFDFRGAWTARLAHPGSTDLVFHFEIEEDAIIAQFLASGVA